MLRSIKRHQNRYAGAVIVLFGAAALMIAHDYPLGTLRAMGPGFFPTILAVLMLGVGVAIALAPVEGVVDPHEPDGLEHPEFRGWACIVAGVASFIVLAKPAGMLPATFACVFIAAMGDRTSTWFGSFVLAASIAIIGTAVFHYGLQIQLAPFAGMTQ